jgi:hypothetical protein
MSALSDYLEAALLNHTFRNSAYSSPTTVYIGLFTSSPSDDGSGTEVSGGSYARQSVAFAAPTDATGAKQIANSADITFPTATASWGTVGYIGYFDAVSSGNLLAHGALDSSRAVETNDQVKFEAGDLKIQLA